MAHAGREKDEGMMALGLIGFRREEADRSTWADFKPHPLRLTKWELSGLKRKLLANCEVIDGGYDTVCWKWTGHLGADGYGRFRSNGHELRAHRASWLCHYGDIPEDKPCICHSCDNKWCIRPLHLFAGTDGDNNQDMFTKGRNIVCRGEDLSRLSEKQVHEIHRKLVGGMTQEEIAHEYQIGRATVSHIKNGETWAHLLPDNYKPPPASWAFGERAGQAKLTDDEARQIRRMALSGSYLFQEIADMFNVSKSAVWAIKHGRTWRHLWQDDELPNSIPAASSTANAE
jgi:predicted DNA-binding protein YlxM (UPF0122 family)